MTEFSLDVGDLLRFGDDLVSAADGLLGRVKPVVAKGALNVKTSMQDDMKQSDHFKQVARSITYDVRDGQSFVEAEIGPKTAGQTVGDLAHLAYFGGAHGGGGTVRDPQGALDDEADNFERALGDVLWDIQ